MATTIAILGTSSAVEADVSNDKALFVEMRPPAFGSRGYYSVGGTSGAIAATLASGSTVFSMRWTDSTRLCVIRRLNAVGVVTSAITTGVRFDLQLFVARFFTASDTLQSSITPSSTENKLRTSMGSTLFAAGDIRIANTAGITAGTRTLDTNPIGRLLGFSGTAAGTFIYGGIGGYAMLLDRTNPNMYPLVLAQNEGIVVTTSAAGPATGTFALGFNVEWIETTAY